jgi:hypothetical protein
MSELVTPQHRVGAATARMREVVGSVADAPVWSMDAAEAHETLVELTRLEAQVAELKLRVAEHAASVDPDAAHRWAVATAQTKPGAIGQVGLAQALATRSRVREALAAGEMGAESARVIVRALERLPRDLGPEAVAKAEAHLVAEARHHDPRALRILGRRLLEVVAPEVADAHEARLLEKEEAAARAACRLVLRDDGSRTRGWFDIPSLHGAMLTKALLAIAAPKHRRAADGVPGDVPGETTSARRRTGPERMGHAFCEYLERYPADRLPHAGGVAATVVVTMTAATLTGGPGTPGNAPAQLDTGPRISDALARRLACEAGIVPMVLGSASVVLDAGRKTRFHTETQRLALTVRDRGCTATGCDWPPALCHAHHDTPWHHGGATSLTNGRLLCPRHHTRAHDPTYQTIKHPDGKISFHRRT